MEYSTCHKVNGDLMETNVGKIREKDKRGQSPVRLSIVCTQLLPEDSVPTWGGQKAALSLCPTTKLHLLNLNGNLYTQPKIRPLKAKVDDKQQET